MFLEINRSTRRNLGRILPGKSFEELEWLVEKSIFPNRMVEAERVNMAEFMHHADVEIWHNVVAIIAFSPKIKHFTVFIKEDRQCKYFNDLDGHVVIRDPKTDWPEGYVEHLF